MVRLDFLIFGYRRLKIQPEDLSNVSSIFIRASIFSVIGSGGEIIVGERDFLKIKQLLCGRIIFEYTEPLGLYGKIKRTSNKTAVAVGLVFSLLLCVFLSSLVWDVRVLGNESVEENEIISTLSTCGFGIGDLWRMANLSEIENSYLQADKRISWININRRGMVAYVSVIEANSAGEDKNLREEYSNILADRDCVIEEITVKSGRAMVKVGDTVKEGDILIQGVTINEHESKFCAAEGSVIGRANKKISAVVNRKYEKKSILNVRLYSIDFKCFKFFLNIFKLYGNLDNDCDIIEDEKVFTLFDKCRLPFALVVRYFPETYVEDMAYSDEEIVLVAAKKINNDMLFLIRESDLVRIRTYGNFTDQGYTMTSDIVYLTEVGIKSEFYLD